MFATVVFGPNSSGFINGFDHEVIKNSDLFIGAIEETTDTAIGVLAAEVIEDNMIAIRHIYVSKSCRRTGAGREMMERLFEITRETKAAGILCAHPADAEDEVEDFLLSCGFGEDRSRRKKDEMKLFMYCTEV